ncbi:MAG TPA: SpoIIE family protein phosphatase [Thermoanaerobaculia bacterium]|nr:SpoIIE family protein phosphatase [Thermoanaerobaculia bacterium]
MSARQRLYLIVAITVVVVIGAAAYSASRFLQWHRDGWTGVFYAPSFPEQKGQLKASSQSPGEVMMTYANTPADGVFKARDRVVAVDGIPIEQIPRLHELERTLHRGDQVTYRVLRGGKPVDLTLRLESPFRSPFIVVRIIISFIVALTFLVVAVMVAARQPGDRRAQVFFIFALISAMALVGAAVTSYDQAGGRGIVANFGFNAIASILVALCSFAYAPLILHFSLIFPHDRPIIARRPYLLRWVYAAALLASFMVAAILLLVLQLFADPANVQRMEPQLKHSIETFILAMTIGGLLIALHLSWIGRREGLFRAFARRPFRSVFALLGTYMGAVTLIAKAGIKIVAFIAGASSVFVPIAVIASYPVLACIALVRSYRESGVEEKRQVQWPLWGLFIAVMTKIAVIVITVAWSIYLSATHAAMLDWRGVYQILGMVPTVVTILIPLSFAAAILKYRLMNIDIIIRKTVAYAFLTGAIIVLYLILVGGLGTLLVSITGVQNQTMVIASTLVVALVFVPLRNRLQTLVDRNLFRHKYDYPEALRAISADTLTANDLNTFLTAAAEKTQQALQNRAVAIFVTRHDELVAAAKVGLADSLLGTMRMRRDALVPLLERPFDPSRHPLPEDATAAIKRIEAKLVVPINTPGTPANGFIALAPKLSNAPFDVEDIDFLRSVADQLDLGIDRIRQQREEADFEQARAIQQSLLPREMPKVAGVELSGIWQPARTMGGDYYDVLKLSDSELAVCIGDVAGKGMTAALLMSGLQAAVRASASGSPRELCERVRRVVVQSLTGGRFVTFFYATIDTAAMRLRWCNAGHNAPVLARADGSVVRLADGGPAFTRLFKDDPYSEKEIALQAGDRLVLFTDGVSEASGGDGEMFGEPRLEQLVVTNRDLGAQQLQQTIAGFATAFTGGELDDDLTLVVAAL